MISLLGLLSAVSNSHAPYFAQEDPRNLLTVNFSLPIVTFSGAETHSTQSQYKFNILYIFIFIVHRFIPKYYQNNHIKTTFNRYFKIYCPKHKTAKFKWIIFLNTQIYVYTLYVRLHVIVIALNSYLHKNIVCF